jgi:hypothetical protein
VEDSGEREVLERMILGTQEPGGSASG